MIFAAIKKKPNQRQNKMENCKNALNPDNAVQNEARQKKTVHMPYEACSSQKEAAIVFQFFHSQRTAVDCKRKK